jgi:hypothetical protein
MTTINQDFEIWNNTSLNLTVSVTDDAGDEKSLAGCDITWVLYGDDLVTQITKTNAPAGGITVTDETGGVFVVALVPDDTDNLVGVYHHEARVDDGTNEVMVLTGVAIINRSQV